MSCCFKPEVCIHFFQPFLVTSRWSVAQGQWSSGELAWSSPGQRACRHGSRCRDPGTSTQGTASVRPRLPTLAPPPLAPPPTTSAPQQFLCGLPGLLGRSSILMQVTCLTSWPPFPPVLSSPHSVLWVICQMDLDSVLGLELLLGSRPRSAGCRLRTDPGWGSQSTGPREGASAPGGTAD